MRALLAFILLLVIGFAVTVCLGHMPFGTNRIATDGKPGRHYLTHGVAETGAANTVTSVVVTYRGFDTLGEVTVLFIAAVGLRAVLAARRRPGKRTRQAASAVLQTGCRFVFPLILVFGVYVFIHGHLSPGGGFQGGVIVASAFLLGYLGCGDRKTHRQALSATESLAGSAFVLAGLLGLAAGGDFLTNFLDKGAVRTLFSAGLIPLIYVAIGLKVGAEFAGIVAELLERPE